MIYYLDTSVLLPALIEEHPQHEQHKDLFHTLVSKGDIVCMSTHLCAELYANLTRFPLGDRIHPQVAVETIFQLSSVVKPIELGWDDYEKALRRCAQKELISGIIYDALHLQAAIKSKADALYTANLKDFERLWDDEISLSLKGVLN